MALYEQEWFIKLVTWLRKWQWFDKYIYGYSKNIEDFARNPAEVLRDDYLALKDCIGVTVCCIRIGFKRYRKELENEYNSDVLKYFKSGTLPEGVTNTYVEMPSKRFPRIRIPFTNWILFDSTWFDKHYTKYPNAFLSLHLGIVKKRWIIIPYFCMVLRFWPTMYFQAGTGWSPHSYVEGTKWSFKFASMFLKFRIGNYLKELEWNPGLEVYGYWEGKC